ncbi:MAG TPA: transcription elongation factor GreA [Bacillota bacterium]|nr:transcription elongation factor GreA [Clostridiales bacterium]HPT84833.1 transcription elongation factor GreA [Bacillota bacterium]
MAKQIYITDEGLRKLKEQLDYLKNVRRKEVVEGLRQALAFGDLSENSEYDEAKNEQAKVEAQILELEETLKNVKIISDSEISTDIVSIGSTVTVYDETYNEETEYTIVGPTEADPMSGKISDQSPIGSALLGAKIGDTVTVHTPGGEVTLRVLNIEKK